MNQFFSYKNIDVSYSDQGKGPVLLLLHGFLENKKMWLTIQPELLKRNRVICVDLLGHGKTGNLGYIHKMEDQANMILALMKSLRLRKYALIGHSMGGYVAMALAAKNTPAIRGIFLMNSTPAGDTLEKQKNRDRAIAAVKKNYKTFVKISIPNLFSAENQVRLKPQITAVTKEALAMNLQGIISALEGMKIRADHTTFLQEANLVKYMLIGEADPVLNKDKLLKLAALVEATTVVLPGGHMSHLEDKIGLLGALKKFTASV